MLTKQNVADKPAWVILSEDADQPLVLEETRVRVEIKGLLAAVRVTQRFQNPLKEAAEITCQFPLPAQAAIVDYQIRIGSRVVRARMEEIESANQAYQEAKSKGKHAALLEKKRPNLFQVRLANVSPSETLIAELEYEEAVGYADGEYEFVFPMGLTPRYHAPGHPEEAAGVDFPTAQPGSKIGPISLHLTIEPGCAISEPVSPTHALAISRHGEHGFTVQLGREYIPDHDFLVRFRLLEAAATGTAQVSYSGDQYTFIASLIPPALAEDFSPPVREFIFVLDRSGSMAGEPMRQARNALRACIRALQPLDTFRILLFDDQMEWYSGSEPIRIQQESIDQADHFLSAVQGRGGTDIISALEETLRLPPDSERTRYIVFLTDGAVSAEERLLDSLRARLASARLFTFGIGPAVNRWLLQQMAELGRGAAEFLQLDEDIEGAIIRFGDRVSYPVLTDIDMSSSGIQAWDVYPARLPDLYAGQPLQVCGRYHQTTTGEPARLVFQGKRAGQPLEISLSLPGPVETNQRVERHWARRRVEDLERRIQAVPHEAAALRAEMISLALRYRVVSPYTTFVAMDEDITNPNGQSSTLRVAQPLPAGLQWDGFFGSGINPAGAPIMASMPLPPTPRSSKASPGKFSMLAKNISEPDARSSGLPPSGASYGYEASDPAPERLDTPEQVLRWLARTQQVDGSWNRDVEESAAALLLFVRSGHTTRTGSYRGQVKRAYEWLAAQPGSGWPAFAAALALHELAAATGSDGPIQAERSARAHLPVPAGPLEEIAHSALSDAPVDPGRITSLTSTADRLRAAALSRAAALAPDSGALNSDRLTGLWLAILKIG